MNTTKRGSDVLQKSLHSCALGESSFSIGRVNWSIKLLYGPEEILRCFSKIFAFLFFGRK